jgi:hypothetical protein
MSILHSARFVLCNSGYTTTQDRPLPRRPKPCSSISDYYDPLITHIFLRILNDTRQAAPEKA